jgi:hypothetical protein
LELGEAAGFYPPPKSLRVEGLRMAIICFAYINILRRNAWHRFVWVI